MNKKILSILFSTRLMAILFLTFAIAMAAGTFIESKYNTDTARIWVYNTWWFEGIMLVFMINFIGNIKRYNLLRKEKWATLILHLSFVFIIAGAFITRYISYEGMMPIREGATENVFYSDKMYLTVFVDGEYKGEMKRRVFEKPLRFSPVTNNNFSISEEFDGTPFEVKYDNYIMGAKEVIKPNPKGSLYFKLVEAGEGGREEHFLKEGEVQNIHNTLFALNKNTPGAINITITDSISTIQTPFEGEYMRMADKLQGKVAKDIVQPLMMRSLYTIGDMRIVFPEPAAKGEIGYDSKNDFKAKEHNDVLVLNLSAEGQNKTITLLGIKGRVGESKSVKIGKLDYTFTYGNKVYTLPFSIKLNDFIAQKYPGTERSFSSFESQVTVTNKSDVFDARIFMNHILDYEGYRFFQSSFDQDEKGTVLSVSHDYWGTLVTYIGYFLLFFAMMSILFTKHSRFASLKRKLEDVKIKKSNVLPLLILLMSFTGFAQNHNAQFLNQKQLDSILEKRKVPEEHAAKFGRIIVQDAGGRMKPINTFASELLRKVSHKNTYKGLNSDQVFLSMTQGGNIWIQVPMIYIKSGNDSLRKIIGIDADKEFASFIDFFDKTGNYKLSPYLDDAYKAGNPNQFEKDFIET
ncbi:MAG: cytochrome c biogenesis protein ResB, partial [Flavobacterium sp.]